MVTLDQQQTLEFKIKLRERAGVLRQEIRNTMDRSSEETHVRIAQEARDAEDDSFSNLIVDTNLAEVDRDADELRRIDGALRRLADGTFGTCIDCDRNIPLQRLEAEPTAVRCVQCQELYEKTHQSTPTPSL